MQDMMIRAWDENRNSFDTIVYDALNVVEDNIPTQKPVEDNVEEDTMNLLAETKDDAYSVLMRWSGYSLESATDAQMLDSIGISGTFIPKWVKKDLAGYVFDQKMTLEDLISAIRYLNQVGIVR